eukprot:jgi/Psemu1/261343/estExt_Genewise1Plus.C_5700024
MNVPGSSSSSSSSVLASPSTSSSTSSSTSTSVSSSTSSPPPPPPTFSKDDDETESEAESESESESLSSVSSSLLLLLRSVPKVELHVHLDGAFSPEVLWNSLQRRNPELLLNRIPLEKKCRNGYDYGLTPLHRMFLCFEFFMPLVHNHFELLEELAFDFVVRQAEQNIVYTEVRYSPHRLADDPRMAHRAVTMGLRRGCRETEMQTETEMEIEDNNNNNDNNSDNSNKITIIANQILCAIDFEPGWSDDVLAMAEEFRDDFPCAVVGIDVAAGETHFDPRSPCHAAHLGMYEDDVSNNTTTNHVIASAILDYGARRIGHGYSAAMHDEVIALAKSRNVHFETCPTSSVVTGAWSTKQAWSDHPANILKQKGVGVSLGSDDPSVFCTSLTQQWGIAVANMGWKRDDVFRVLEDTIDAAFAPEDQKRRVRRAIQEYKKAHHPCCRPIAT